MGSRWLKLNLRVSRARFDAVAAELWALGTVGLEQRSVEETSLVEAYFQLPAELPGGATESGAKFWASIGATLESVEIVAEDDWLAEYRRHASVFPLGQRFLVDPREPGCLPDDVDGRVLLQLPARQAFGIGSHESTSLVVEWLENQGLGGLTILDVGTGTGILSFVALRLGALRVVAVEIDPTAGFAALINQRLNRRSFPTVVGSVAALASRASFDMAVVNVLPQRIVGDLEQIATLMRPGGLAVFSGLVEGSSQEVTKRLERFGFTRRDRLYAGEWEALVVEKGVA